MQFSFTPWIRVRVSNAGLLTRFHEWQYDPLVKPRVGYSVVLLTAPLAVFIQ